MASLTKTSAEVSVPGILVTVTSFNNATREARHYVKLGHTVHIQPYHYSHSLTRLTYVPDKTSPCGYSILKGI